MGESITNKIVHVSCQENERAFLQSTFGQINCSVGKLQLLISMTRMGDKAIGRGFGWTHM